MGGAWFAHTPVSKALTTVTALSTVIVLSNNNVHKAALVAFRVVGKNPQWWRIVTSLFPLSSVPELLCSLYLISTFRVLERHMGSAKFGSFLFLVAGLAKGVELAMCLRFPTLRPPTGPIAILSALVTAYYGYIPAVGPTLLKIGNLRVTDKAFTYFIALWLFCHDGWNSGFLGICGIALSLLYFSGGLPIQQFRVPGQRIFKLLGRLLDPEDSSAVRRRQMADLQRREQGNHLGTRRINGGEQLAGRGFRAELGSTEGLHHRHLQPSEEDIATLTALGYDRATVLHALQVTGNSVEAAANRLLGSM